MIERPPASPPAAAVAVRLLGEASLVAPGGERRRFESQSARLLLAYLAGRPGTPVARERLARLLWPEEAGERALHNLRQALYALRRGLANGGAAVLAAERRQVTYTPDPGCWLDWLAFEAAARRGRGGGPEAPAALEEAAALYRGPFLAGVAPPADDEMRDWLRNRRDLLRETALDVLDALVAHHAGRGEHAQALERARRRAELEPAEGGDRSQLVRLAVAAGETGAGRAAAPAPAAAAPRRVAGEAPGVLAPLLPLAGRDDLLAALVDAGAAAFAGPARATVVSGAPGSGRSRLVNTALAALLDGGRKARVLRAAAPPGAGLLPWAGLRELVASLPPGEQPPAAGGAEPTELPWAAAYTPRGDGDGNGAAAEALAALVRRLVRRHSLLDPVPLALVVDDADAWDAGSLEAVARVAGAVADLPVWLILVAGAEGAPSPLAGLPLPMGRLDLPPLAPRHLHEAAQGLLGGEEGARLGEWLSRAAASLPLAAVEAVRLLADRGGLVAEGLDWRLVHLDVEPPDGLATTVARRAASLPASARHLLPIAAAAGPRAEVALLTAAADEHPRVVEIALGVLIERGFLRRAPGPWKPHPGPRDPELWHGGARRGRVGIAHAEIGRRLLAALPPEEEAAVAAALAAAAAAQPPSLDSDAVLVATGCSAAGPLPPSVEAAAGRLASAASAAGDTWTAERVRRLVAAGG
jgi:DNA-binding SARP family transcriptional activator